MTARRDQAHTGLSTVDPRTEQHRPLKSTMVWRRVGAGLLVVHGIAHLVGTTDAIRAINDDASLSYVFDRWEITDTFTLAAAGVVWAMVAAGFAIAGTAVWVDARRWRATVVGMAAVSTVLCVIALPQTFIGLVVNAVVLTVAARALPKRPGGSR